MPKLSPLVPYYIYIAIISAVILQVILLDLNRDHGSHEIHPDTRSSLRRALTEPCKAEISQVADDHSNRQIDHGRLTRTCHLDSYGPAIYKVGCLDGFSANTTLILESPSEITNLTLCLDLCFSYGHRFGGLSESKCHCGDGDVSDQTRCNSSGSFAWFRLNDGIYDPSFTSRNSPRVKQPDRDIRIVFLLQLNGRSVDQIRRLIRLIYDKKHLYYIHVDGRTNYLYNKLLPLQDEHDNMIVTNSRFTTVWGSPRLLNMIIDAIKRTREWQWDYMINLSESDLPLKSLDLLENHLSANYGQLFLKSHNMKGYDFVKKQGLDRLFHQCDNHVWRLGERLLPAGIIYSGGSDWFALPRDFCDYTVDNLRESSAGLSDSNADAKLVTTLMSIFNHTLLPVESFFHTLALNSKFCDRFEGSNLRLTNWQRKQGCKCQHREVVDWCGCSPMVYRSTDTGKLSKTLHSENLFFSRKFDPTISASIINFVENELVNRGSLHFKEDTRHRVNVYDRSEDNESAVYTQLARMAPESSQREASFEASQLRLQSVDLYFNQDQFVGYLTEQCDELDCLSLTIVRNTSANLRHYDDQCLGHGEQRLQALDIHHGFDTNEKLFRDYSPLHQDSDIVVYHEWLVQKKARVAPKIKFIWYDPMGKPELSQDAKIKRPDKLTHLSLAHRLNVRKPLMAGIWRLVLKIGERNCLEYEFLVLGRNVNLTDFGRHYSSYEQQATSDHKPM